MITNIKTCENDNCVDKPMWVMRLTSAHGELQNPFRIRNRTPARIAVCDECSEELMHSQLRWERETKFTGELNATGDLNEYENKIKTTT